MEGLDLVMRRGHVGQGRWNVDAKDSLECFLFFFFFFFGKTWRSVSNGDRKFDGISNFVPFMEG